MVNEGYNSDGTGMGKMDKVVWRIETGGLV